MYLNIILLLTVWQILGAFASIEVCQQPLTAVCVESSAMTRGIPKNEEELQQICIEFLPYLNCLGKYIEECGLENTRVVEVKDGQFPELLKITESVCNSTSTLNRNVVENLPCLQRVWESHRENCGENNAEKLQILANKELGNKFADDEFWRHYTCVSYALEATCFFDQTSKTCGADAKTLFSNIIFKAGVAKIYCGQEQRSNFAEAVELLDVDDHSKDSLMQFIDTLQNGI